MIVVKLGDLVASKDALMAFSKNKMTSAQRKSIYDTFDAVATQVASFEKIRAEKAQELGEKGADNQVTVDDKGMVTFSKENFAKFVEEMNALAAVEVSLPGDQLSYEPYDAIALTLEEQKQLDWLFKF